MRRRRVPKDEGTTAASSAPQESEGIEAVAEPFQSSVSPQSDFVETKGENKRLDKSYIIARELMLRLVAAVYFLAFYGAYCQNLGLMGSHGLVPAQPFMNVLQQSVSFNKWKGFMTHPTLYWWISPTDTNMNAISMIGTVLSIVLMVIGDQGNVHRSVRRFSYHLRWIIFFWLWLLYFSIVTLSGGTSFYSYGWESQLLETGFLCIFLCRLPIVDGTSSKSRERIVPTWTTTTTTPILWLFRWLCFRISIGAGLIKIRGSSCWVKKTCLHYHFETQPLPSPLSFVFHFLPKWALSRAVDLDLFVQLYTSWFVLVPDFCVGGFSVGKFTRRLGGFIQAGFMINIMLSGNFSILNHITIVPALACLDEACFGPLSSWVGQSLPSTKKKMFWYNYLSRRSVLNFSLVSIIGYLSIPTIANLWGSSGRQVMNASFDPFRLVNTYGAFGSVGEARYEPIVSVSSNMRDWREVEFPCKPGLVTRRPCFCAPYHYRLDWNIWFIGFKPHQAYLRQRESWLYRFLEKLLDSSIENNAHRPWLALLDKSAASYMKESYDNQSNTNHPSPIRYAKVDMYHYKMAHPLWEIIAQQWANRGKEVVWWNRTFEESLIPPVELETTTKRLRLASSSHSAHQ